MLHPERAEGSAFFSITQSSANIPGLWPRASGFEPRGFCSTARSTTSKTFGKILITTYNKPRLRK